MAGIFSDARMGPRELADTLLGGPRTDDARRMRRRALEEAKAALPPTPPSEGPVGKLAIERGADPMSVDPFTAVDQLLSGTVPAYSQARREGLRAPTPQEAVMGAAQWLPGAGLPEAQRSFQGAAGAAMQGDAAGTVGGVGWGALNMLDAALPGPAFAAPLGAMAAGAGSRAGREAMGGKVFLAEDSDGYGDLFATLGRGNPVAATREEAAEAARRLLVEQDPYYATLPAPKVRWSDGGGDMEPGWVVIPPRDRRVEPFVLDEFGNEVNDPSLADLYAEPKQLGEELARRGYELIKGRKADDGYEVVIRLAAGAGSRAGREAMGAADSVDFRRGSTYIPSVPGMANATPGAAFTAPEGGMTDAEGRALVGRYVVGRRGAEAGERSLDGDEAKAVVLGLTGNDWQLVPRGQIRHRADGSYNPAEGVVRVADDLDSEFIPRTLRHELGHVLDRAAGMLDDAGIAKELDGLYKEGSTRRGTRGGYSPRDAGYPESEIRGERVAEALRIYMEHPEYLKTVAPKTAARIRKLFNENPRTAEWIQFNGIAGLLAVGGGALAAGAMAQPAEAQETP